MKRCQFPTVLHFLTKHENHCRGHDFHGLGNTVDKITICAAEDHKFAITKRGRQPRCHPPTTSNMSYLRIDPEQKANKQEETGKEAQDTEGSGHPTR